MTTLLITGAGGFLGSHILQAALHRTNDLSVVAVDSFNHNGGIDRILQAMADTNDGQILDDTRKRVRLLTHDLTAPVNTRQQMDIGRVDYVVHAAARVSVDDSIADPYSHVHNNLDVTLNTLALALDLAPTHYLHISTDEVYGDGRAFHVDEHRPSSPYAASKAACEDLTRAWRSTYHLPASVVTSANLFGERQSQLAFIPKVIRQIRDGEPVTIHTQANQAPAHRWYTYAPNLAAWVIEHLDLQPTQFRHTLSGQVEIDMLTLAARIAAIMGRKLEYKLEPGDNSRPGFDTRYSSLPHDPTWLPGISMTTGLERTVHWFLEHPRWLVFDG